MKRTIAFFLLLSPLVFSDAVTVISPNGEETLISPGEFMIEWTALKVDSVDIDYSLNNGADWHNIVAGTENDGEYSCVIPIVNSSECLIRVTDNKNTTFTDTSDAVFTIFTCIGAPIPGDINNDCYVNLEDLVLLCENWLYCGNPLDPACLL